VLVFSWLSGDPFLTWGIPFLISIVMVGVGCGIRLGILETPVFQKVIDEERIERVPVIEVLKRQPREGTLTALLRLPEQAPSYIFGVFVFTYEDNGPRPLSQLLVYRRAREFSLGVSLGDGCRTSVGSDRPQAATALVATYHAS
jgi:hypothetical protein